MTCEVAVDQLDTIHAVARDRSQAEFLADNGLAAAADDARRNWEKRAHIGDLEALKHRSRLTEADALTDTDGLGAFRVLEWDIGR